MMDLMKKHIIKCVFNLANIIRYYSETYLILFNNSFIDLNVSLDEVISNNNK